MTNGDRFWRALVSLAGTVVKLALLVGFFSLLGRRSRW